MSKTVLYKIIAAAMIIFFTCVQAWGQGAYIELGKVRKYTRVIVAAPVGNELDNGTLLLDTLDTITDNGVENPYLVRIEPGIYNVGASSIQMDSFVDIQGAGRTMTFIKGAINASDRGLLLGSNNARMSCLNIENLGGGGDGTDSIGVFCNGTSPRLSDMTVIARDGNRNSIAVYVTATAMPVMDNVHLEAHDAANNLSVGLYGAGSSALTMRNSEIFVSGGAVSNRAVYGLNCSIVYLNAVKINAVDASSYGIFNSDCTEFEIFGCQIQAQYGAFTSSGSPGGGEIKIDSSVIIGSTNSLRNDSASATIFVGASRIEGSVGGNVKCANAHDGNYTALDDSCGVPSP